MFVKIFFLAALLQAAYTQYLTTGGNNFYYNGKQVHLSGVNIAWNSYGYDFGNGQYATNGPQLEKWIKEIHNAGGNTLSEYNRITNHQEVCVMTFESRNLGSCRW